jgi:hypothetical protein
MSHRAQKYIFLFLLLGLFFAQFLYISPKGEFALNDDWVHTDAIKHWVDTGEFRLMPYAGPSFYVQILYGTTITKIFGFSFTTLRISTLVLTLFLLSTFYFLLFKLSHKPSLAFLGTLILWFNPIFYNLSFTFMTDVPALCFLVISIYFYYLGFESNKAKYLFWGTIFGLISAFTRQTGILIVAAALIYLLRHLRTYKLKNLIICFGIPLAIGGAIYVWLLIYNLLPQSTFTHSIQGFSRLLGHIKWWLWYIPMYLALFTLPLTLGWLTKHHTAWKNKKLWTLIIIFSGLAIFIREYYHLQFPYIGNMLNLYGLGPIQTVIAGKLQLLFPGWIWGIITLASTFGLSLISYLLSNKHHNNEPTGFIYLFGILFIIPLLVFESFDRYLLPLLAVLIIALIQNLKHLKFSYLVGLVLILPLIFFSLTQTRFYLAWNQARWDLGNQALTQTNNTTTIDGGYEWDGWHSYWSAKNSGLKNGPETAPWWIYQIFNNNTEDYIISFSPFNGYEIMANKFIPGPNPNNHLYLLKKNK